MSKILKSEKGVNLVTLSVTVIIIMAILGIVLYNIRTNLGVQRLQSMQADIENLRGKISNYYLQYGALPILKTEISASTLADNVKTVENSNIDTGKYYIIDLSAIENLTLTYGEDYEKIKVESESDIANLKGGTLTDVYVINSVSHNIFYVHGIKYEGKMYYKEYQDVENNDIGISGLDFTDIETDNWSPIYATMKKYKDKNEDTAVIPAGFQVSRKAGEDTIENGLVVRDENENEWVWIPVSSSDLAEMYTEDSTGWIMSGTEVVTKYKTIGTQNRVNPGNTSGYREPDILNNTKHDNKEKNWTAAGFVSYEDMATKLRDDYKNMIDSLKKYGGFYVGRYELGGTTSLPQEKAGTVMNNANWYNLYKACKTFGDENTTCSRMIWGCQWDQVCKFISTYKEGTEIKTRDLTNSCSYGNYGNSIGDAATNSGSSNFNNTTGRNAAWKANNIYDLAGNCWEFTQEASNTTFRAARGGRCNDYGDIVPVTERGDFFPRNYYDDVSSRAVLYIK